MVVGQWAEGMRFFGIGGDWWNFAPLGCASLCVNCDFERAASGYDGGHVKGPPSLAAFCGNKL